MKRLIVLALVMVFIGGLLLAQEADKSQKLLTKEEREEIGKILDKVAEADTDEDYFAIPKEERDKLNKALYEIYIKTEDKELKERIGYLRYSPGERWIIKVCQEEMDKQQKEWQKYVADEKEKIAKEIIKYFKDYKSEQDKLIEECLWAGYWVGKQSSSVDMSRKIKEFKDIEKMESKLKQLEDLLGFIITDIERKKPIDLDIRIKPPR